MHKRFALPGILIALSLLLSAFLPATVFPVNSGSTFQPEFNVETEINFESTEGMNLIGLWMDNPSTVDPASLIKDGALRIGAGSPFSGLQVHPTFRAGHFIQVRLRISEKVCFPVQMNMSSNQPNEGEKLVRIDGCPAQNLISMLVRNIPDKKTTFGQFSLTGKTMVKPGEWLDIIFWLHPDGDKVFTFTGNGKELAYGSVTLPDDWQSKDAHLQVSAWPGSNKDYVDVDLIRWGTGSIQEYLAENLPGYPAGKEAIDTFLEAAPQAFPEFSEQEPSGEEQEQPQEENDQPDMTNPDEIMKTFLDNPVIKFNENVDNMKENNVGQFGPGSEKVISKDGPYVSFIGKSEGVWTPLNTPLDQFDNKAKPGGNQAIYFKFQALPPDQPYFTFMGPMEFNIDFWEAGKPRINWLAEFKKAPLQNESFALEKDKWYYMVMGMDKDGKFVTAIWEEDNPKVMTRFQDDFSTHPDGEKYKNASWKFILGSKKPMTINLEFYRVLTFDSINAKIFE